jgi:calcineurin-like phosphoesterase family protein
MATSSISFGEPRNRLRRTSHKEQAADHHHGVVPVHVHGHDHGVDQVNVNVNVNVQVNGGMVK